MVPGAHDGGGPLYEHSRRRPMCGGARVPGPHDGGGSTYEHSRRHFLCAGTRIPGAHDGGGAIQEHFSVLHALMNGDDFSKGTIGLNLNEYIIEQNIGLRQFRKTRRKKVK